MNAKDLILSMVEKDQKVRIACESTFNVEYWTEVHLSNTRQLKEIIQNIGWPTISKVGKEASEGAWLLAQHADHDVEFQKYCLGLMIKESPDEVPETDIAYLHDRICVNQGIPQFFGTQFTENTYGAYGPESIIFPEAVDNRRSDVGLEPLGEYKLSLMKKYNI